MDIHIEGKKKPNNWDSEKFLKALVISFDDTIYADIRPVLDDRTILVCNFAHSTLSPAGIIHLATGILQNEFNIKASKDNGIEVKAKGHDLVIKFG
jgi:hypothetical protein